MAVICFASLKGGVGKTSLSINVAHAFAKRGCETLLIDLDPIAHASRFFRSTIKQRVRPEGLEETNPGCPLAQLFLRPDNLNEASEDESLLESAVSAGVRLKYPARESLQLIPGSADLRHFLWGKGARAFGAQFSQLIGELRTHFDHIVIDTCPDYNVITRNAIAVADLVAVPVDSSEMSIFSLEELVNSSAHIKGPTWVILRSMVHKQAARTRELATTRLKQNLSFQEGVISDLDEEESIEDMGEFMSMLRERDRGRLDQPASPAPVNPNMGDSPIYLLNSLVYRTEQQNRLSFLGKTAFDSRQTSKLAEQYLAVAKEIEEVLAVSANSEEEGGFNEFYAAPLVAG